MILPSPKMVEVNRATWVRVQARFSAPQFMRSGEYRVQIDTETRTYLTVRRRIGDDVSYKVRQDLLRA
jgi:hypothetical protein